MSATLDFSLSVSDKLLHFGLHHQTSRSFAAAEREGNCIEYAELFAKVFEKAAQKGGLKARVFVVHSDKARVFGQKMPSTSSDSAAAVAVADEVASEAVADGGASITVVVAEASPAAADAWSADGGSPSDLVVPDVAEESP